MCCFLLPTFVPLSLARGLEPFDSFPLWQHRALLRRLRNGAELFAALTQIFVFEQTAAGDEAVGAGLRAGSNGPVRLDAPIDF